MKKKRIKSILLRCTLAAAVIAAVLISSKTNKKEYVADLDDKKVEAAFHLLNDFLGNKTADYAEFMSSVAAENGQGNYQADPDNESAVTLDYNQYTEYTVTADRAGLYNMKLTYRPMETTLLDYNADITINGVKAYDEMGNIALPLFWHDRTKEFPTDRYGDETAPYQERKEEWTTLYLYNGAYSTADPLLFWLESGENVIRVKNISGSGLGLGRLEVLEPQEELIAYADYGKLHKGEVIDGLNIIHAFDYTEKNTSQAIYESINDPAVKPHDNRYKKINSMNWSKPGTEVEYEFEAPQDGFYHIALHYNNPKEEFDVFNTIRIDGEVPFSEMQNYAFDSTGSKWANKVLADEEGTPYSFYMTEGNHTISLRSEMEPIERAMRYARVLTDHVTQFDMAITKITGTEVDRNRTWKMTNYIPEIPEYLEAYRTIIHEIKYLLQDYTPNGVKSAMMSELNKAVAFIDQMAKYPDEIALYQANLAKSKDNSILKSVSEFNEMLSAPVFNLNAIYVYGNDKLPKADANIAESFVSGTKNLINSYTSDKFASKYDPDVVNVWVERATTHVDLLQKMIDTKFTPETGIKVKVSVMPDSNKLVLATAADDVPDAALGLISDVPFELASRGALYDLTQFDDFWEVADRFVPGAFVSYLYNEGVYAIPETLEFETLVYRTDIFDNLGLTPPDTWEDVTNMCPTLQRYGMNFYHIMASGAGYKWYYQTTSMLFQNGGKLYTDDGLRTAIDQPKSVKALQKLGDLFVKYSLPKEVGSFFNEFRYGTLPVGTVSLDDYILIKNGAPELTGKWALAPYPGTVQEDGTVDRSFVCNGTGGIIFGSTEKAEDTWEFMKWWTDYDTQVEYTYTLQSTYGEAFIWLPSNVRAFAEAPLSQADKQVIMEQVKWLKDVPRTPGQYMVERTISDVWNEVVNKGKTAQVSVDEMVVSCNREIKKKMTELGYYDKKGNLINSYTIRDAKWVEEQIENAKKKGE